jgi:hypothetical protein
MQYLIILIIFALYSLYSASYIVCGVLYVVFCFSVVCYLCVVSYYGTIPTE